jgi:hypothetical protein
MATTSFSVLAAVSWGVTRSRTPLLATTLGLVPAALKASPCCWCWPAKAVAASRIALVLILPLLAAAM